MRIHEQSTSGGFLTVSFDDGYLNQFTNAFPIMKKFGYHGVAFVITGLIGQHFEGRSLMEVEHLNSLEAAGWEIGSHSISHPYLTRLAPEALTTELLKSKKWGEDSGFSMEAMAYPYGDYNDLVEKKAGGLYKQCRTYLVGLNDNSLKNTLLRAVPLWEKINECTRARWIRRRRRING